VERCLRFPRNQLYSSGGTGHERERESTGAQSRRPLAHLVAQMEAAGHCVVRYRAAVGLGGFRK
jgi:hypothetical protein